MVHGGTDKDNEGGGGRPQSIGIARATQHLRKIVAEADRDLEPDHIFRRTIQYGMAHYPELSRDKQWERFLQHMDQKYSAHGYIRLWMPGSPNESKLRVIRELLCDQTALRATFDRIFEEELKAL